MKKINYTAKFKRLFVEVSLLLLVPLSPLFAQDLTIGDFDKNGDNKIDINEFKEVFTRDYWQYWEHTDDRGLSDKEFYTTTFNMVDTNDDDLISSDEWEYGYGYYYGDSIENNFVLYDLNRDGYISYPEYSGALYNKNYFSTWDLDYSDYLSVDELAERVFKNWDIDKNGSLGESEFKKFDYFYNEI